MLHLPEKIETDRLILSIPVEPTFELAKEAYAEIDKSRDNISRFLPWPMSTHSAETYFIYLVNYCKNGYEENSKFAYIITNKETGKFLGVLDICSVDHELKRGEFGYWLSDSASGHGYMSEALKALEKTAFQNGFNRLIIRNAPENHKSVNVAKNAGYILEGVMRQDHLSVDGKEFLDVNIWGKTKEQWEKENK